MPSRRQPADSRREFARSRKFLDFLARATGQHAGLPLPIDDEKLVVSKRLEFHDAFAPEAPEDQNDDTLIRNVFYSQYRRCDIVVYETQGRVRFGYRPRVHHFMHDLRTLGCSVAWGIEQERKAQHTLCGLITAHQFKSYLLTGMFLESSGRSRITYCFRRLKPTVALAGDGDGQVKIRCALCMHPVAYYEGSFAGALCPTDDVIAHLMLMRADERLFWARSQQHPAWHPEAGL